MTDGTDTATGPDAAPLRPANDTAVVADDPTDGPAPVSNRPGHVPEKFWDADAGALRTEALLRSYHELERRLGAKPASAEAYEIETADSDFAADPAVNEALYAAGFTNDQAQTAYTLAERYLAPMARSLAGEIAVQRDVDWLAQQHGGEEAWRRIAPQIKTWAEAKFPPEVYAQLASTREGVSAMYRMMTGDEPAIGDRAAANPAPVTEAGVKAMMRDPRYWRDQDPAFVAKVREGFERLYPD